MTISDSTGLAQRIRLDGRPVLVAGAGGGGIGTAVCAAIAGAGGTVVAVDQAPAGRDLVSGLLTEIGGPHVVLGADLTEPEDVDRCVHEAVSQVGALRGSVHVVGGMLREHWGRLDAEGSLGAVDDVLNRNLRPTLVSARAVARSMHAEDVAGSIVTIASTVARWGMPYGAGYAAAKAALVNLTATMALEWGRLGTRVNAVAPGSIRVERQGRERYDAGEESAPPPDATVPLGRRGVPGDVAGAVLFLLSDLAAYITGHTLVVDGGAHQRAPYTDADDLPVFVTDPTLRAHLTGRDSTDPPD